MMDLAVLEEGETEVGDNGEEFREVEEGLSLGAEMEDGNGQRMLVEWGNVDGDQPGGQGGVVTEYAVGTNTRNEGAEVLTCQMAKTNLVRRQNDNGKEVAVQAGKECQIQLASNIGPEPIQHSGLLLCGSNEPEVTGCRGKRLMKIEEKGRLLGIKNNKRKSGHDAGGGGLKKLGKKLEGIRVKRRGGNAKVCDSDDDTISAMLLATAARRPCREK